MDYQPCQGQALNVNQNQVLYSLIGLTYGGNGSSTFNLPDFRGRVPVGYNPTQINTYGVNISPKSLGNNVVPSAGVETVTLTAAQVPLIPHTHTATVTSSGVPAQNVPVSAPNATLYGVNGNGGQADPGGNFLGADTSVGATNYVAGTPAPTTTAMASGSVKVDPFTVNIPQAAVNVGVTINQAGAAASSQVSLLQPYTVVNYIIAVQGLYPPRP
ncbi:phage tail protein [Pedobacter nyackensis]|uniref:phage tail protein n=1 Tax=Pedobacter nyackensis TaxID=475255 RepID=UPI0039779A7C